MQHSRPGETWRIPGDFRFAHGKRRFGRPKCTDRQGYEALPYLRRNFLPKNNKDRIYIQSFRNVVLARLAGVWTGRTGAQIKKTA
jgi:hypothetical protein